MKLIVAILRKLIILMMYESKGGAALMKHTSVNMYERGLGHS